MKIDALGSKRVRFVIQVTLRVVLKKLRGVILLACIVPLGSLPIRAQSGNGDIASLTGSGKTDYVPLWLGPSNLGNSVMFQSSGKVGIGTTTPGAALDVSGAVNASNGFNLGGARFGFGSVPNRNAFLGFSGNSAMTGVDNTAAGVFALQNNTTGYENTAVGYQALFANTTGYLNTAMGVGALFSNTTGITNTAFGYALLNNTTGSNNTATAYGALVSNTTGFNSTATGWHALSNSTTGSDNTANGYGALGFNTTGNNNTADGMLALYYNTTGNSNTALGWFAGPDIGSPNLTYTTAIGAGAVVSQSNALVLGGPLGSGANVNVGIGTATPSNVLTIAKGAGQAISDGWSVYSSRRWKTNIQTLDGALERVEQLRGVSYDATASGKHEIGVIAEEVGAVVPEVVAWERNGEDAQGVDYSRLTALLIEATKEQQALIREQQQQLKNQQEEIARLASQMKIIRTALESRGGPELQP
jgi:hypothetical protein